MTTPQTEPAPAAQTDYNLLESIGGLLLPQTRERAILELKERGVIGEDAAASLAEHLGAGRYTYRAMFTAIAPVKLAIDQWTRVHRFNKLRPTAPLDSLARYADATPELLTEGWLVGKDVLDFGAGIFSPISVAVVLYLNGARSITAFEPAGWKPDILHASVRELVAEVHTDPARYAITPHTTTEAVVARLADIRFERLDGENPADLGPIRLVRAHDFQAHPDSVDLIVSTSVFEHVESFDSEIDNHLTVLRSGGVSVNRVDFTDHRHRQPEFRPFGFYADGLPAGCNLFRVSDLEAAAKRAGAVYQITRRQLAEPGVVEKIPLLGRFAAYDLETLRTMAATFVLRK